MSLSRQTSRDSSYDSSYLSLKSNDSTQPSIASHLTTDLDLLLNEANKLQFQLTTTTSEQPTIIPPSKSAEETLLAYRSFRRISHLQQDKYTNLSNICEMLKEVSLDDNMKIEEELENFVESVKSSLQYNTYTIKPDLMPNRKYIKKKQNNK